MYYKIFNDLTDNKTFTYRISKLYFISNIYQTVNIKCYKYIINKIKNNNI